jgi:hypothetical protein
MSFSILKTNVGLTTNTKIMIDSKHKMYLESIDSVVELSSQVYKKFEFNKDSYYDETLSLFLGKVPSEISYSIRYEDDNDNMYTNFHNQNDELYQCGARNIYNNKSYSEEYEYFAPLYLDGSLPSNFIIFRVDGPGNINLSGDNFIKEIVHKLKVVKSYDLSRSSILGEWLYKNYIENEYFINDSLLIDFRESSFSSVGGIDVISGGYVRKSLSTNELFTHESTFTDMNTYFHSLYAKNSIVYPNIINLNYLYDDTPSTSDMTREWSLNRYYGFYFDSLDIVKQYTFYTSIELVESVLVGDDNELMHIGYDSPFVDINSTSLYYVEINGVYSKIVPSEQVVGYGLVNIDGDTITQKKDTIRSVKWKILSPTNYKGYDISQMNKHGISISNDGDIIGAILPSDTLVSTTDLWLFKMGDEYVVVDINIDTNTIKINSDHSFEMIDGVINMKSGGVTKTIKSVDGDGVPVSFGLYRCNFSEIKDFDTNLINSGFANFEYDIDNTLVKTDESKLYYGDYSSSAKPVENDEFLINGKVENVPVSSEFIANGELFELVNGDLSALWRKNPSWCKWGYTNSLNTFDYPYLLNNSILGEDFNRGVNVYLETPDRVERNLDYFYTVMSDNYSKLFSFQSLHVSEKFDVSKYMSLGENSLYGNDYFSYYFGKKTDLYNGSVVVDKWSKFNDGNGVSPNNSLFRGMKFNIYDVNSIKLTNTDISELNVVSSASFSGYKLSILASVNDEEIQLVDGAFMLSSARKVSKNESWIKISQYELGVNYELGDIVMYYGIIWNCVLSGVLDINPILNPVNSSIGGNSTWEVGSGILPSTVNNFRGMWQPNIVYDDINDVVYYDGEYMKIDNLLNTSDVWNPTIGYPPNSTVFKGGVYYRTINGISMPLPGGVIEEPGGSKLWQVFSIVVDDQGDNDNLLKGEFPYYNNFTKVWGIASDYIIPKWKIVNIWEPNNAYKEGDYIYWDGTLYRSQWDTDVEPGYDESVWKAMHTLEAHGDIVYPIGQLVTIDNDFYISSSASSGINSGITIYINKKWSNILININSYDGLITNIENAPRDLMYSYENGKITAYNFIEYINGLNIKGGFSKSLTYVVINEDSSVRYYNGDNISDIPYYINIEKPDVLYTIIDSLVHKNVDLNMNKFKINFSLDKSNISSLGRKNWYNGGIGLATKISKNLNNIQLVSGYHGLVNVVYNKLFRYSGDYSPIFKTVELFTRDINNVGNYKFGTDLVNFGMVKDVVVSKVNRKKNILKLNNVLDTKSVYPMIDEFGYTVMDKFIFKSTWDSAFYCEVVNNDRSVESNNKNNKIIN